MGFIEQTGSTVELKATLTEYGKKKLFSAIKGDIQLMNNFITKFSLGDSDCNYNITIGQATPLSSGHVPDVDVNDPRLKSMILYNGSYPPGKPYVYVNGSNDTNTFYDWYVQTDGGNQQTSFEISCKWGGRDFDEVYNIIPTQYVNYISKLNSGAQTPLYWDIQNGSSVGTKRLIIGYNPNYSNLSFFGTLVVNQNTLDLPFELIGKQSKISKTINIKFRANQQPEGEVSEPS